MEKLFSGHGWTVNMEEAPLPDGRIKMIARAHRADSAHIIAFTKPGTILLLKEFRPFYKAYVWMLPTGKVDKESDPLEGAQRELQEETGYRAKEMHLYSKTTPYESLGLTAHIFVATDLVHDPLPQDEAEMIEVHELPIEEALEKVLNSDVIHTASSYALLRYLHENPNID